MVPHNLRAGPQPPTLLQRRAWQDGNLDFSNQRWLEYLKVSSRSLHSPGELNNATIALLFAIPKRT